MMTPGNPAAAGLPSGNVSSWHALYCRLISRAGEIGRCAVSFVGGLGRTFLFLCAALAWALRRPIRVRLIIEHIRKIGVDSLSVVLLSGAFTGMVGGLQGYYSLRQFNAEGYLGSAVALSLLRELVPVLSAFLEVHFYGNHNGCCSSSHRGSQNRHDLPRCLSAPRP